MPEAEALNTVTFTEVDGRTTLTILVQHTSKEHRDAHINFGMEAGMQEAMDLLEQVAVSPTPWRDPLDTLLANGATAVLTPSSGRS